MSPTPAQNPSFYHEHKPKGESKCTKAVAVIFLKETSIILHNLCRIAKVISLADRRYLHRDVNMPTTSDCS